MYEIAIVWQKKTFVMFSFKFDGNKLFFWINY